VTEALQAIQAAQTLLDPLVKGINAVVFLQCAIVVLLGIIAFRKK
jgi:hypothetical protein